MKRSPLSNTAKRILIITIIVAVSGLGGFFLGRNSHPAAKSDQRNLRISVADSQKFDCATIPIDGSGSNFNEITYWGIRDVTVTIGKTDMKLEEAIQKGYISIEEILSQARLDASLGVCEETGESENGLTTFIYRYPEFDLMYIYDLYETPDAENPLISKFAVCKPGRTPSFLHMNDQTGKPIDYEDWGLDFTVTEVGPAGIWLECTQSGGQHFGNLLLRDYTLNSLDLETGIETFIDPLVDDPLGEMNPNISINPEGSTEISLDFSQSYAELPAGDYVLYLIIDDQYSVEGLHPFMRNYYDEQLFGIVFSIA